jgi:hypothetical protein
MVRDYKLKLSLLKLQDFIPYQSNLLKARIKRTNFLIDLQSGLLKILESRSDYQMFSAICNN